MLVLAIPLRGWLDLANIVMLFLLTVFVVAIRLGRGPAVLAAFLSVALFDIFFVPPHLSFSVVDAQYLITFAVMLAVGLITSHLAARLAERTEAAQAREQETRLLFELARDLGTAVTTEQVVAILDTFLAQLGMKMTLMLDVGDDGRTVLVPSGALPTDIAIHGQALACYREKAAREAEGLVFLPLPGTTRVRGVLVLAARRGDLLRASQPLPSAVASLTGIAIERLHYADVAQRSELTIRTEKLRSSILASISHDLRTPLTSLVGQADVLAQTPEGKPWQLAEKATVIRDQAQAMHRIVSNLLEMARLQSGNVALNKQWHTFDDIVGSSVRLVDGILSGHPLTIDLPADLPLVLCDAVLMERVVCNLLENAAKYSAPTAAISIGAQVEDKLLAVRICNEGCGFPADGIEQLFELFSRGEQEAAIAGTGIGLAVCRTVILAHGGTIRAENLPGMACIHFTLPLETAPYLEGEPS